MRGQFAYVKRQYNRRESVQPHARALSGGRLFASGPGLCFTGSSRSTVTWSQRAPEGRALAVLAAAVQQAASFQTRCQTQWRTCHHHRMHLLPTDTKVLGAS